uniref:Putative secreted protein n=1 Tax=Ixodes ricinus TaxID=34613 RepID=A0A6B0TY14_IXORI
MDSLVRLQGVLVVAALAVAAGHHELPLHLRWLDNGGLLKVLDGLLKELRLNVVGSQPLNDLNIGWEVPVRI